MSEVAAQTNNTVLLVLLSMLQVVLAEQRVDHSLGLSFSDVRLLTVANQFMIMVAHAHLSLHSHRG